MSDDEAALLQRKKKERAGHQGATTRLTNQIATAVEDDPIDADQLQINRQLLTEKLETFKVLDAELVNLVPEDDLEDEILVVDEYKEKIYGALAKLEKALTPKVNTVPPIPLGATAHLPSTLPSTTIPPTLLGATAHPSTLPSTTIPPTLLGATAHPPSTLLFLRLC